MSDKKEIKGMVDGGNRISYESGGIREPNAVEQGNYALISPIMLERLAIWCAKGAEKYEKRNWEKGISLDDCMDSCLRHINKFRVGRDDEDHLTAAIWNLMAIIHLSETKPEFNDMPVYNMEGGNDS